MRRVTRLLVFLALGLGAASTAEAASAPAPRPDAAAVVDPVFRSGFEDGDTPPCEAVPDADGDGLLDLACAPVFAPPDPATVAPPPDKTVVPEFIDLYDFLPHGALPVQRGVGADAIDPVRAA